MHALQGRIPSWHSRTAAQGLELIADCASLHPPQLLAERCEALEAEVAAAVAAGGGSAAAMEELRATLTARERELAAVKESQASLRRVADEVRRQSAPPPLPACWNHHTLQAGSCGPPAAAQTPLHCALHSTRLTLKTCSLLSLAVASAPGGAVEARGRGARGGCGVGASGGSGGGAGGSS